MMVAPFRHFVSFESWRAALDGSGQKRCRTPRRESNSLPQQSPSPT